MLIVGGTRHYCPFFAVIWLSRFRHRCKCLECGPCNSLAMIHCCRQNCVVSFIGGGISEFDNDKCQSITLRLDEMLAVRDGRTQKTHQNKNINNPFRLTVWVCSLFTTEYRVHKKYAMHAYL